MESERSGSRGVRRRVLVADDDPDVCDLVRVVLEPRFDVICVCDAESALAAIAEQTPFDAIVSDFMLPGLSGIDLVERVRRDDARAYVPVLMISGHGSLAAERARAAGVDAFLEKPFTVAELRSTIDVLLAQAGKS